MEHLAPCAIDCLAEALANSTCLPTDVACQCTDVSFKTNGSNCIIMSCSVREALSAQNITLRECGVAPAVDHSFLAPVATFLALAGTTVVLRIAARFIRGTKFWWDDLCNFLSFLVGSAYLGLVVKAIELGLGTDLWAVPQDNVPIFFRIVLSAFQVYGICRFLVRCSIILFYIRIFEFTNASKLLWITFAANLVIWIVWFLLSVFQCRPVSYFWNQWDGEHTGSCFPANFVAWSAGAVDLAEDLVLLAIPFPYIRKLHLGLRNKIATAIMFTVGLLTIISSIVRFPTTYKFTISVNTTVDIIPILIWSCLELYIGIICASLPSVYPILKPILDYMSPSPSTAPPSTDPVQKPVARHIFTKQDRKRFKPDWDITLTALSGDGGVEGPYTHINDSEHHTTEITITPQVTRATPHSPV